MNLLYNLPKGDVINALTYVNGVEIAKMRTISKFVKKLIDENETIIYHSCLYHEFPKSFKRHYTICRFRDDWKNLYVLTDQYEVGKARAIEHRKTISRRESFLTAEKYLIIVELILSLFSVGLNFAKIATLGWSASSSLIKDFLKANPGSTVKDAITSLGLSIRDPLTIEPNFYD